MTPEEAERELRRRLREDRMSPERRRRLRQWLIIGKGHKRWQQQRVQRMSMEQLLNNWAAALPQHPDKLVDLSDLPDRQLLRAALQHDIGRAGDKEALSDSAIAELRKRANTARLTVADYVRRRPIGPFADE
jgi:hypothetical protein